MVPLYLCYANVLLKLKPFDQCNRAVIGTFVRYPVIRGYFTMNLDAHNIKFKCLQTCGWW